MATTTAALADGRFGRWTDSSSVLEQVVMASTLDQRRRGPRHASYIHADWPSSHASSSHIRADSDSECGKRMEEPLRH
jgi:hypothetical protein